MIVICGPTASGKTDFAIELAEKLNGEIINADSMQLYRGMDIGTAKNKNYPQHLIDVLDVTEDANVAWYQESARVIIDQIEKRGKEPIICGGTGLYIKAILDELNFPETNPEIRDRLNAEAEELGKEAMFERLQKLDPAAAIAIDAQNLRRVIRALEVIEITGKPFTANLPREKSERYPNAKQYGLRVDREELDRRIDLRVDKMFAEGLIDETAALVEAGLLLGTTAKLALGYAQVLSYMGGQISDPIEATKIATRQYARRQETWFNRDERINWITDRKSTRLNSSH